MDQKDTLQPTAALECALTDDRVHLVHVINQQEADKTTKIGQIHLYCLHNSIKCCLWEVILLIIISFISGTVITSLVICVGITDCSSQAHQQHVTINETKQSVTLSPNIICPSQFVRLSTGCYFFSDSVTLGNWHEAYFYCHSLNSSRLVIIESLEEQEAIVTYLKTQHTATELSPPYNKSASYWIGLTCQSQEGEFIWSETGMAPTYTAWACNQPDNYFKHQEDCVQLINIRKLLWNDLYCGWQSRFLCEAV